MSLRFSMLLPARGRPQHLRASVESIFRSASSPSDVEVLVRLDDDDRHLQAELAVLRAIGREQGVEGNITVEVGPRKGYRLMMDYWNELAAKAQGDWIYLWNDDIEGITAVWDDLLREAPAFSIQWPRRDITATTDFTLPVIGKPVYEALGHVSVNAYADAWIADYSGFAGTSIIRDDVVFMHHRLNDETLLEQQDGNVEWTKFSAEEQRALRNADLEAVKAAPGYARRFDGWRVERRELTLDYLRLRPEERPHAYVLLGRAA